MTIKFHLRVELFVCPFFTHNKIPSSYEKAKGFIFTLILIILENVVDIDDSRSIDIIVIIEFDKISAGEVVKLFRNQRDSIDIEVTGDNLVDIVSAGKEIGYTDLGIGFCFSR